MELIKKAVTAIVLLSIIIFSSFKVGNIMGHKDERLAQQEVIKSDYIKQSTANTEKHNAVQAALDAIGKKHSDEMATVKDSSDAVIDNLKRDNKRLLVKLKGSTSTTTGDSSKCIPTVDGKAELDETTARDLIAITERGDKWIGNLQDTVRTLQGELSKQKEVTSGK